MNSVVLGGGGGGVAVGGGSSLRDGGRLEGGAFLPDNL